MNRCRPSVVSRESSSARAPFVSSRGIGDPTLGQALARAGDGACAIGPDGRITLWNRAAERILGWSAMAVLGRPCREVFGDDDGHGNGLCYHGCDVMGQVRLGEPVEHFEMKTRTKAGRPVWLDVSILAAPAVTGSRTMAVHLFRDVTATRALLEAVQERLAAPAVSTGIEASGLTRREVEILRLMAAGADTKVMAERLHVSPATIRNHAQNIFAKLKVHSRLEAVAWANRHGLV